MGGIATISGVALVPGVSSNRRLYTPELINKAAKRMQARIADPDALPIVMRTHHEAGDDSAKIVGRVTKVTVGEDNALRYEADLYDTFHGREIANLVTPKKPALRSVSIHGYWIGGTRQEKFGGQSATTADDLEIDAIDFTASPGVSKALIDPVGKKAAETVDGRTPISESMEASVAVVENSPAPAVVSSWSAQRGRQYELDSATEAKYNADQMKSMLAKGHAMKNASGEPSYPIADKADLAKAIKAVGRGKSSHDAIRRHIIKRARALGAMDMIPDNWKASGSNKETEVRLGEVTEYYPDGSGEMAGFCIDAYAGPLSVTVRGCVAPDELAFAAKLATVAAMKAVNVMDPDADGDMLDADDIGPDGQIIPDNPGEDFSANGDVGPDDDMESASKTVNVALEGTAMDNAQLVALIREMSKNMASLNQWREELGVKKAAKKAAKGSSVTSEMVLHPDDHSHTHEMDGSGHTHAHTHDHPAEGESDGYSHGHTHTHVHASTDGPQHDHGHNHIHNTSSSASADSNQEEESAVCETTKAAEAAPGRNMTDADVAAIGAAVGESVGGLLAEAIRAMTEQTNPKHAAPTQETTEPVAEPVTESTSNVMDEIAALKESLAKAQKELRNEMRAELLAEKGLPPRRGYRLSENDEEEEQLNQVELFDKYRADIMLGDYGRTPSPQA